MPNEGVEYQLGLLNGQVAALTTQVGVMTVSIKALDDRLRANEANTTVLTVKMSLVGAVAGALSSIVILVAEHFIK